MTQARRRREPTVPVGSSRSRTLWFGAALVAELVARGAGQVFAASRQRPENLPAGAQWVRFDLDREGSIAGAAQAKGTVAFDRDFKPLNLRVNAETAAFVRTFDEAGNIRNDHAVEFLVFDDSEIRYQRGEVICRDLGTSRGYLGYEGRLASAG